MSHGEKRSRVGRLRAVVAIGALSAVVLAGALASAPASAAPTPTGSPSARATGTPKPSGAPSATAAPTPSASPTTTPPPAPVGTALALDLPPGTVLTLPAGDGLRDRVAVRIRSGKPGRVDVDAVRGKRTVHLAKEVGLRATSTLWQRTVAVKASQLTAGGWRIRVQRSADHTVRVRSTLLTVGTGAPLHVAVTPAVRKLYPYADGVLDGAVVTVVATDETEQTVPVTGSVRIDAGKKHVTRALGRTGTVTVPITALPLGPAVVTATVTGPSGKAAVRRTGITLLPTGVGTTTLVRSSDTVQPVVDGLLDSVVLTTGGTASAASPATVSGTLTVRRGTTVAAVFTVPDGTPHAYAWNGRVAGVVVPGTYTVALTLQGPQGPPVTRTRTLVVTKDHLPYAVQEMFTVGAGNQQGLAVRDNRFYIGYDTGNDTSRIDVYDGSGKLATSLGPLPIPHVAELAYSTTTGMLYAATGGRSTPTRVFVLDPLDPQWTAAQKTDPAAVIRATYDFSTTLGNNAMVSVDDVNKRLLVFSGATGAFSVSSVSLTDVPVTNPDGSPALNDDGTAKVVPAGTITATVPVAITGVPQGMDLVGQQLWIYTSLKTVNHVAKYDLSTNALLASAASGGSDLYWGGEGEGMATVAATDTNDGLPAWIYVGAHDPLKNGPNHLGRLVPVADE